MAFRITMTVKGTKELIRQMKRRTGEAFERAKRVQNDTARNILTEAQSKVPKLTYDLTRSARRQEDPSPRRTSIRTLGVTYDPDYAVAVHEDMEAKHKQGEEAKFLEKQEKKQLEMITPDPPPRYDRVYFEGMKVLFGELDYEDLESSEEPDPEETQSGQGE